MAVYYFDFRASGEVAVDEEGFELPDMEAAHDQALEALIGTARGVVREGEADQHVSVQVRDAHGPVLEVSGVFNSVIIRKQ